MVKYEYNKKAWAYNRSRLYLKEVFVLAFSYKDWKSKKKKSSVGQIPSYDSFKKNVLSERTPTKSTIKSYDSFEDERQERERAKRYDEQAPKSQKAKDADAARFARGYETPKSQKAKDADAARFSGGAQADYQNKRNETKTETSTMKTETKTEPKKNEKASLLSKVLDPFKTAYKDLGIGDVVDAYNPKTVINSDEVKAFTDKDNDNDTLIEKRNASLRLGVGDTIKGVGQGLKYVDKKVNPFGSLFGMDDKSVVTKAGDFLSKQGDNINDGFEDTTYSKDFNKKAILDPEWYATSVTRAVPNAISTILPGLGAAKLLGNVNKISKLPTVAKTIIQSIGGAAATTAYDSTLLSGGVYEEALKRGMTEEQAVDAADKAFFQNTALTGGTTALEFGLGLTPISKGLSKIGKVAQVSSRAAGGAALESFQEGAQTGIEAKALGDDFKWTDPSTIEAMLIGGILGGTMTGGMATYGAMQETAGQRLQAALDPTAREENPVQTIMENTIADLPTEIREEFDEAVFSLREQGFELEEARESVFEEISKKHPTVIEKLQEKSVEYKEDAIRKQTASANNPVTASEIARKKQAAEPQAPSTAADFQAQLNTMNEINNAVNQDGIIDPSKMRQVQENASMQNTSLEPVTDVPLNNQTNTPVQEQNVQNEPKQTEKEVLEVATGDKVNLQGTKASTVYEVKSATPTEAVVKTPTGKTITIPKSRIKQIVEAANEQTFDDEVESTIINEETPVIESIGDNPLPPNFRNDVKEIISEFTTDEGMTINEAVEAVKSDEYYQGNAEWSKIIEEEAAKHFGYKSKEKTKEPVKQAEKEDSKPIEKEETKKEEVKKETKETSKSEVKKEEVKKEEEKAADTPTDWKTGDEIYIRTGNQKGKIASIGNGRAMITTENGRVSVPTSELMKEPKAKEEKVATKDEYKVGQTVERRVKRSNGWGWMEDKILEIEIDKYGEGQHHITFEHMGVPSTLVRSKESQKVAEPKVEKEKAKNDLKKYPPQKEVTLYRTGRSDGNWWSESESYVKNGFDGKRKFSENTFTLNSILDVTDNMNPFYDLLDTETMKLIDEGKTSADPEVRKAYIETLKENDFDSMTYLDGDESENEYRTYFIVEPTKSKVEKEEVAPKEKLSEKEEVATKETPKEKESTEEFSTKDVIGRIEWFNKKMRTGVYTKQNLKNQFEWLRDNEESIKEALYQHIKNLPAHKRKRENTKREMADKAYETALERPIYGDKSSVAYTYDMHTIGGDQKASRMKQLEEKIEEITDETISRYLKNIQSERDEKQRMVDNPETIRDFIYKRENSGLSVEEQAKLDELQALNQREKQAEKKAPSKDVVTKGDYTIEPFKHTKTGEDLFNVKTKPVPKAEYPELARYMKSLGGTYSRYAKGFLFKTDPTSLLEGEVSEEVISEGGRDAIRIAERLRKTADGMQKTIDDKRNDNRKTNTHKRATEDAYAREEADRLERQQNIMKRVADAIESGEATFLDNVTARTHIETLDRVVNDIRRKRLEGDSKLSPSEREKLANQPITEEEINNLQMPKLEISTYHLDKVLKANVNTKGLGHIANRLNKAIRAVGGVKEFGGKHINGEMYREDILRLADSAIKNDKEKYFAEYLKGNFDTTKRLEAMNLNTVPLLRSGIREYIKYVDGISENTEQKQKDAKRKKEAELSKLNIDGFFPTPTKIIDRMLEEADIQPGMKVLEPSAGKGNIAARIKDEHTDADLDVVEYNFTLNEYLESEGYNVVGDDFLEHTGEYDRIVMNPPFEKGQDIDHVLHAYEQLKPGGRVVAIMSEGPFFRGDKKSTSFREFLDENGTSEQLDEGSFKESERTTGVATRIVTIDKPVENNRDTYVIERVGAEPFVVNRGDEVLQFISNNKPLEKVTVTSISHAKKEINGTHYGSIYPLDYDGRNYADNLNKKDTKNIGKAYTENGTEIEFEYRIVDASDLIASNGTDMKVNKDYPKELQPRDRSRKASQQQVQTIAQKLNPELLGESSKASDGAPIVGPDMVVESGNGRTIALQKMYEGNYETKEAYDEFITEFATKHELDFNVYMDNPVLVRVRTNEVDRKQFVAEANVSNVAAMSSTEQAVVDAEKMNNKLMTLFTPAENGDLNVASNRAFITSFMGDVVAANERGRYMTQEGGLSQEGLIRVRNAVFQKAYGKTEAISLLAESTDNNVRIVTNAMLQSAPRFAIMKDNIQKGSMYNEDITQDIVEAMVKLAELRSDGTSVKTFLDQTSMFDELSTEAKEMLNIFDDKTFKRSAKALNELFNQYVNVLEAAGAPNQIKLFDDAPPTKADLLTVALKRVKQDENGEVQSSLFEAESDNSNETRTTSKEKGNSNTETFVGRRKNANQEPFEPTEAPQGNDTSVTRSDIIDFIQKSFKVRTGVGKTGRPQGIYKNKLAIMRTKRFGDFEVMTHELGHHIDFRLGLSSNPQIRKELVKFAEANLEIPKSWSNTKKAKEGVAEYFRQFLYNETVPNVSIDKLSEEFHAVVEEGLQKHKWSNHINELQQLSTSWLNRTAVQELTGVMSPIGESKKARRSPKRFMNEMYTKIFEEGHPIFMAMEAARKETGKQIEGKDDAYALFRLSRGTTARAATFVSGYTFDSEGNVTGESLEKILKDVDDVESFGRYLIAKRGLYLKKIRGKSDLPFSDDLISDYLTVETPKYKELAKRIYAYQEQALQVLVDGGLIDPDLPAKLKENDPYYVPFFRVMNDTGIRDGKSGNGKSNSIANQQQGIKRMSEKGSSRNIINPIESIIKNTHLFFALADRNSVGRALSNLADPDSEYASEISKDIIEAVPGSMKVTEVALSQIKKTLLDSGLNEDILEEIDMDKVAKVFNPIFRPNSVQNEILVWKDGSPKLFKVHDQMLYDSLIAADNRALNNLTENIIFKGAKASNNALRWGITASPYFTLRTFARSVFQLAVKTEATGFNYLTQPGRLLKSVWDISWKKDSMYKWWESGGAQSTLIAVENEYLEKKLDNLALNRKALNMLKFKYKPANAKEQNKLNAHIAKNVVLTPFKILQSFNDILDQSLKMAEYQVVLKQTGDKSKAAIASRDADVDYRRMGSAGIKQYNQINLFFNVSLQGPDNIARTFAKHKVRTTLRGLTLLTLPTILLYMMNRDDEEYEELNSWEKDLNWMIPKGDGTFYKIPIPFEIGLLFKTIPEKLWGEGMDFMKGEDKQTFDEMWTNASKTLIPSVLPTAADVFVKYKFKKDFMNDRDFVPQSLQGLEVQEQYTETTSEIMKWFGKKVNRSPIVLEETFKSQFAQMGQAGLWGADAFLDKTGIIKKPDLKGVVPSYTERYITSSINDGGTASITSFYDKKRELEVARNSDKNKVKYYVPKELDTYNKAADDLRDLNKLKNEILYDKIGKSDGSKFSKEEKKQQVDVINQARRDIARYVQGKEPLNQQALIEGVALLEGYEAYQKALDKEARKEAKKLKALDRQGN